MNNLGGIHEPGTSEVVTLQSISIEQEKHIESIKLHSIADLLQNKHIIISLAKAQDYLAQLIAATEQ